MDTSTEDYYINFQAWIELQLVSTHANLLELIADDLYRRHYGMQAGDIKSTVKDLRAMTRHHKEKVRP